MFEERVPKKILDQHLGDWRGPGRSRKIWVDVVRQDVQTLGIPKWRICAADSTECATDVGKLLFTGIV